MTDFDIFEHANDVIKNPEEHTLASGSTWPIGTILPYFPHKYVELPLGWYLCAGQKVNDPDSPFKGRNVPNLVDERFAMGTINSSSFGKYGGTNDLQNDGNHNHGGRTGGTGGRGGDNGGDFCSSTCHHTHSITAGGAHDHGGENRPQWFGLVYIIKIKDN